MSATDRCDRIMEMIDEVLGEYEQLAANTALVPSDPRRGALPHHDHPRPDRHPQ